MTRTKKINEQNVAKFVEKLNEVCHKRFDLCDPDFYAKYGRMYDFRIHTEEDGTIVVYDYIGTFDHYDSLQTEVNDIIDNMAEKNGWYTECVHGDYDFCFAEI